MEHVQTEFFDYCLQNGAMGEEAGKFFLHQLTDTLSYIHHKKVAHRDLKLDNMLIDDKLNIKLLDFGLACQNKIEGLKSIVGTHAYMAPELHERKRYNGISVDVFSLGVILHAIVVGKFPFETAKFSNDLYALIKNGQTDRFFERHKTSHLTPEFKDLIVRMLAYDANERPSIDVIKSDPWMCQKSVHIEVQIRK